MSTERITVINNGEVVGTEQGTANAFLSNVVTNLKTSQYTDYDPIGNNISNPILKVIVRYRNHPGIFTLDIKKATQESDISSRIINENSELFGEYLLFSFNDAIDKSYFPTALKQAYITPVFKTGERYSKDNYRHISILPNVSKIFEKCMFRQASQYVDNFLSKHHCGFRKG